MPAIPLMQTQLVPPRMKNYLRRARMGSLGLSILSNRVTTVTAPAGYGKSVWVSSLLEEPGWPATAWLSLDSHDSEPSFLLYHLIHSIRRVLPGFGKGSLLTMNSLEDAGRDWQIAASSLIEEIPEKKEMVLVLDDFYLIDKNPVVCSILEHLIHWLPAGVHLVLISRTAPPLNLYRERLNGDLLEIAGSQLQFSLEETGELLSLLGMELQERDVELIHDRTEGWAVGLRLLAMLLKQWGGDLEKTLAALKQKDADLYTYLNNELLGYLPGDLHDFLLESSLLPYLEPELCDTALNYKDSAEKIRQLHSQGILSRAEGETVTWRLHHLMAEFLEQKVTRLQPPEHTEQIRHRAASYLESRGDIDRALEQVVACADWAAAASLIKTHGDEYFLQSGRVDSLYSWISRLPREIAAQNQWILYFRGMSLLHGKPEEALDTLSLASETAAPKGDTECQLRSLLAMIAVYTLANNVKKVKETAGRTPVVASLLKDSWSRGVVLVAALGRAAWEDNLRQGVWLSRLAGKSALDPESKMAYLIFSSVIQYRLGNLASAGAYIEKALADPYVQENERWTGTAYTIYAVICVLSGDLKKLEEICRELLRLGKKYNAPQQLGIAYRRRALLYINEGMPDKARKEYELSRRAFMQANNIFYCYLTDLDLILLRITAGENARDLLPEAQYILNKLRGIPGGQGLDDYSLSVAGVIAIEAGQLGLARKLFEELAQNCRRKGARQVLAGTRLFLARIHLLQGDEALADKYLLKALGSSKTDKWEYFWDWHAETVYSLCKRAVSKNIQPLWAAHLLQRWFPNRTCKESGYLLAHPNEAVRNSTTVYIRNIARQTGLPVIHINCLGEFRVFVNGMEVPGSRWKTKKAENLFKYLVLERHQHPKEKIIEELWPESDPRLGDASLRMALTHSRKALGLNEQNCECIILKRGMIYLNPQIEIHTDYDLFISTAQGALQSTDTVSPVVMDQMGQAAGLYQGELLPDNLYDEWTYGMRLKLQQIYLQILQRLIEYYRRQGKPLHALQICRRYLALEPADEQVCRTAMELLWQEGQKHQALSLYQELASFMAKEFNETPSADIRELYEKIRAGEPHPPVYAQEEDIRDKR